MKNKILFTVRRDRQQGISLVVSLIMLLIMTVIGISAMNTSLSKIKLTSGIQQQSNAANDTEESLSLGEQNATAAANDQAIVDNAGGFFRNQLTIDDLNNTATWDNAFTTANGAGNFIIEFLGPRVKQGGSLVNLDTSGEIIFVFRITARVNNNDRAERMFQSLFISDSAPLTASVTTP